jgi:hypothetical protein
MMTREDMLRELELLPVWQLRTPAPEVAAISDVVHASIRQDVALKLDLQGQLVEVENQSLENIGRPSEVVIQKPAESSAFTHIASECGEYLFMLPNTTMSVDELQLFQNICKALRIKAKPAVVSADILASITDARPKLLLVMDEATAQVVLQSAESIANLRDKPHQLQGIALIATYGLPHLLQNPADKAKVWCDLCVGLQILQDLKVKSS